MEKLKFSFVKKIVHLIFKKNLENFLVVIQFSPRLTLLIRKDMVRNNTITVKNDYKSYQ